MELHDRCPNCLDGILMYVKEHNVLQCDCCDKLYPSDMIYDEGKCDCEFCKALPDGSYGTMILKKILKEIENMSVDDYNELFEEVYKLNERRKND